MADIWIKKDAWNKIIDDIQKIKEEYRKDPINTRLYFYGVEVWDITYQRATENDMNEWLSISILAIGTPSDDALFGREQGVGTVCIGCFDKWYMDEASIRDKLSNLEIRRIDVVKKFQ